MSKYIIKNCPAYDYDEEFNYHICKQPLIPYECSVDDCKDCTDCVMKQIVELAKGHTELCKNCEQQIKECDCNDICNAYRLDKILKLLDIQEVE